MLGSKHTAVMTLICTWQMSVVTPRYTNHISIYWRSSNQHTLRDRHSRKARVKQMLRAGGENTSQKTNGARSSIQAHISECKYKEWSSSWKRSDAHWPTDDLAAGPCAVPAERGIRCSCLGQNGALLRWLKDFTLIGAHGFNTVTLHRNHTPAAQTILLSYSVLERICLPERRKSFCQEVIFHSHSFLNN